MRKEGEKPDLPATAWHRVEDCTSHQAKRGKQHHAGGENGGGQARHEACLEIGGKQRRRETDRDNGQNGRDDSEEEKWPLVASQPNDCRQDAPAITVCMELAYGAFGSAAISAAYMRDGHGQF